MDSDNSSDSATAEREAPASSTASDAADEAPARTETVSVATDQQPAGAEGPQAPRRRRRRRRRRPMQAVAAPGGGEPAAASPDAGTAEDSGEAAQSAGEAKAEGEEPASDGAPPRTILRLRPRRRRRRPPVLGLMPGPAQDGTAAEGTATDGAAAEGAAAAPRLPLKPGQRSFSVPRRQRRQAPLSAVPAGAVDGEPGTGAAADAGTDGATGPRPARSRNRRRRRAGGAAPEARQNEADMPAARGPRSRRGELRDGPAGAGEGRGDRREADARGDRGPRNRRARGDGRGDRRGGPGGRNRAAPKPIERKLYSFDSVVDRGFDDVEEEEGTRRVPWTIVKRTTADQISRKALSAVYVLQRDGTDSEFPNLGAARSAVNKIIVHPEKLTRSKAEHAAEKAGKK